MNTDKAGGGREAVSKKALQFNLLFIFKHERIR